MPISVLSVPAKVPVNPTGSLATMPYVDYSVVHRHQLSPVPPGSLHLSSTTFSVTFALNTPILISMDMGVAANTIPVGESHNGVVAWVTLSPHGAVMPGATASTVPGYSFLLTTTAPYSANFVRLEGQGPGTPSWLGYGFNASPMIAYNFVNNVQQALTPDSQTATFVLNTDHLDPTITWDLTVHSASYCTTAASGSWGPEVVLRVTAAPMI